MRGLLVIVFAGIIAVAFALNNMHHAELGLIVGRPIHVRMFFLLLTTFLLGHFSAVLLNAYVRTRMSVKLKEKNKAEQEEEDEFFSD